MSHSELDDLKKGIEEMISNGQLIPTPSGAASGWVLPVLYVKKKTGEKRLCVQFQDLNAITPSKVSLNGSPSITLVLFHPLVQRISTSSWQLNVTRDGI